MCVPLRLPDRPSAHPPARGPIECRPLEASIRLGLHFQVPRGEALHGVPQHGHLSPHGVRCLGLGETEDGGPGRLKKHRRKWRQVNELPMLFGFSSGGIGELVVLGLGSHMVDVWVLIGCSSFKSRPSAAAAAQERPTIGAR